MKESKIVLTLFILLEVAILGVIIFLICNKTIENSNLPKGISDAPAGLLPLTDPQSSSTSSHLPKSRSMTCDIIIPCIPNHVKFLKERLTEIDNQTRKPDGVIIALSEYDRIKSNELENSLKEIFSKVSVLSTEKPQKAWDNRDRGAVYSNADVYCFLDADDRVHPQRVEAAMEKFESMNVLALLCEGSTNPDIMDKQYEKDSFSYITGTYVYENELKRSEKFEIQVKHFFDCGIQYSPGVIIINSDLWWSLGGQSKIALGNQEVLDNNGIGEDIVFIRTIINELEDKDQFIIMRNPLLVMNGSVDRNETHWDADPTIGEDKTLPEVKILIKNRVDQSPLSKEN